MGPPPGGECHIREVLDASDVMDGAKSVGNERTLAFGYQLSVLDEWEDRRITRIMNRELMYNYYYQGDSKYFTRCRNPLSF